MEAPSRALTARDTVGRVVPRVRRVLPRSPGHRSAERHRRPLQHHPVPSTQWAVAARRTLWFASPCEAPALPLPHLDAATRRRIVTICALLRLWPILFVVAFLVPSSFRGPEQRPMTRAAYAARAEPHAAASMPGSSAAENSGEDLDALVPSAEPTTTALTVLCGELPRVGAAEGVATLVTTA